MPPKDTIRALLAGAARDPWNELSGPWSEADYTLRTLERAAARIAWSEATVDALRQAMRAMDERCTAAVKRLSAEEFERLCDEEQAKVNAIRALLDDVIERDKWPRELHWPRI